MQWADKGTLAENSVSERPASVRTLCLSRKYRTVAISKYRDRQPQRLKEPSLPQRDGIDASKIGSDCRTRLAHEYLQRKSLRWRRREIGIQAPSRGRRATRNVHCTKERSV